MHRTAHAFPAILTLLAAATVAACGDDAVEEIEVVEPAREAAQAAPPGPTVEQLRQPAWPEQGTIYDPPPDLSRPVEPGAARPGPLQRERAEPDTAEPPSAAPAVRPRPRPR